MSFSDKLKEYRNAHNYTQEKFSNKVGVSQSVIAELESGRRKVTLKTIEKIASKTGTKVSDWIDKEDKEIKVNQYEPLDTLINVMIETGMIKKGEKLSEDTKTLLIGMLEKEIDLKFERLDKKN